MEETKILTCITCPLGCTLKIYLKGKNISRIEGNKCKRGPEYAEKELFSPLRTVCSTVQVEGGIYPVCPVKTDKPIPKELIMACMKEINRAVLTAPVSIGQVVIQNVLNTGSNIVTTRDLAGTG